MNIVPYEPHHFNALRAAALSVDPLASLAHRPFVDYYYAGQPWCSLFLALDEDGHVLATQGVEQMPFVHDGQVLTVGCGSNFHSFRPGAGAFLFLRCLEGCPLALIFGGSDDTHQILRRRKLSYFDPAMPLFLNRHYDAVATDTPLRRLAKRALERFGRRPLAAFGSRVPSAVSRTLSVREEQSYGEDLLPRRTPFTFRFAPGPDYLNWRYNTRLPFVRYRLFRVLDGPETSGYVVLNDAPGQLVLAHCDGDDPETLAYGAMLSMVTAARDDAEPRSAMLVTSHAAMREVFERLGFKPGRQGRLLALGGRGGGMPPPPDTSSWLINFEWGDNGLRAPFLDQAAAPAQ